MKRIIITAFLILVTFSSVGLLPGCASPTPVPEPPTTLAPETLIPSNYSTYIEEGLYKISYPQDWEVALSILEELEQVVKDKLMSENSELPLEQASVVFFAGKSTEEGYLPNVNITVEALPQTFSLDEYVETSIRGLKTVLSDYHEFSRIRKVIDGREIVIVDYKGDYSDWGEAHWLFMTLLDGKVGWNITITSSIEEFSKYEGDFYLILYSFKLLK